jgi:hypothetical protein
MEALKDVSKQQPPRRTLEALVWLTDPRSDFALYMETADMGNKDIFQLLTSGMAGRL